MGLIKEFESVYIQCHACGEQAMNPVTGWCQLCDTDYDPDKTYTAESAEIDDTIVDELETTQQDDESSEEITTETKEFEIKLIEKPKKSRKQYVKSLAVAYEPEFVEKVTKFASEHNISRRMFVRKAIENLMLSYSEKN